MSDETREAIQDCRLIVHREVSNSLRVQGLHAYAVVIARQVSEAIEIKFPEAFEDL